MYTIESSKKTWYSNLLPIFILCALVIASCKKKTKSEEEDTYKTTETYTLQNVSYGSNPQQKMDIYLPANRSVNTTKVFVLIHGGGWAAGDKADFNFMFNNIKIYYPNHAIININYRLANSSSPAIPKQIDDIQLALNEIQKSKYAVSKQYFFMGASAGGHLALLYSYGYDQNHYVKAVCNTVGPTDFTDVNYTSNPLYNSVINTLVGATAYLQNPAIVQQVSPAFRVSSTSPPTISFFGGADTLIPSTQMALLHDKLTVNGVYNEATMYPGEGHGGWNNANTQDFTLKLVNFVNTYFP